MTDTHIKVYSILGHEVVPAFSRYIADDTILIELRNPGSNGHLGAVVFTATICDISTPNHVTERMVQRNLVRIRDVGKNNGMFDALIQAGIVQAAGSYPLAQLVDEFVPFVPSAQVPHPEIMVRL